MTSNSKSNAKYLLVLSAVIASISIYFGNQWTADADILLSAAPKFEKEAKDSKALYEQVTSSLSAQKGTEARPLTEVSALFITEVRRAALRHAIQLNQLTLVSAVSSETIDINSLAKQVGNSQLKAVSYKITAGYVSYDEFRQFLTQFDHLPVALTSLTVQGTNVEAEFTLYGV